jgi:hypothetical protein
MARNKGERGILCEEIKGGSTDRAECDLKTKNGLKEREKLRQ